MRRFARGLEPARQPRRREGVQRHPPRRAVHLDLLAELVRALRRRRLPRRVGKRAHRHHHASLGAVAQRLPAAEPEEVGEHRAEPARLLRLRRAVGAALLPANRLELARELARARRRRHRGVLPSVGGDGARKLRERLARARRLRPLSLVARARRRAAEDELRRLGVVVHFVRRAQPACALAGERVGRRPALLDDGVEGGGRQRRRQRRLGRVVAEQRDEGRARRRRRHLCELRLRRRRHLRPMAGTLAVGGVGARVRRVRPLLELHLDGGAAAHEPEVRQHIESEQPTLQFEAGARRRHVEQQPARRPRARARGGVGGRRSAVEEEGVPSRRIPRAAARAAAARRGGVVRRTRAVRGAPPGGGRRAEGRCSARAPPSPAGDAPRASRRRRRRRRRRSPVPHRRRQAPPPPRAPRAAPWRRGAAARSRARRPTPLADRRAPPPPPPPRAPRGARLDAPTPHPPPAVTAPSPPPAARARAPPRARGSAPRAAPPPPASRAAPARRVPASR